MKWFKSLSATTMIAMAAAVITAANPSAAQDNTSPDPQVQGQQDQAQQDQGQQEPRGRAQQSQDGGRAGETQREPQSQGQQRQQQARQQDDEPERRKLQVFELEHREPQQLMQLLNLWGEVSPAVGYAGVAEPFPQRTVPPAQQQRQEKVKVVIATENEKKLLFARGTDEQLHRIEALINAIDVEDDQLKALEFADHKLIPIQSQAAVQIQTTLSQLDLVGRMIPLGAVNFFAYRLDEDEDKLEQAEQVINKLASNREPRGDGNRADRGQGDRNQGDRNQGDRDNSDRNAENESRDNDARR